ncbi:MarR family transcriptional regulator [Lapillicoccus jejuensis]|uniref:MarR family protein n=1 Tax=Lapillicoccus jejuensis TaxID=402171 RepID=A0A542E3K7_9MICO|nr:MarR family transcriptional regulator [Lapillicoccus jejuensis]TQJ09921.1 MarR family protein [Lapillicoccus jejuensis]
MTTTSQPEARVAAQVGEAIARLQDLTLVAEQLRVEVARFWGLTVSEILALTYLDGHGPLSQRELAEGLSITPSAVTVMVDRLIARGFVAKSPHPTDRRRVLVRTTLVDDGSLPVSPNALIARPFLEMDEAQRLAATELMDLLTRHLAQAAARVHDLESAAPPRRRVT